MSWTEIDARVHFELLRHIIATGHAPHSDSLAASVGISLAELGRRLETLAEQHALVLHPDGREPWVVHPFSLSPTAVWVRGPQRGWWAPCIWCGFGIATLVGGHADVRTRIGAEDDEIVLRVREGRVLESDLLVHFAVEPRNAWRNVLHFCATVLPFWSSVELEAWCSRHGYLRGAVVPIGQVMELGRAWYGSYLDPSWRKWTIAEARAIFERVGLSGPFWELPDQPGRF